MQVTRKEFMNNFYLVGSLMEDAVQGQTNSGTKISRIKLSVEKSLRDQEVTSEVFEVVLFRNLAEQVLKAGDKIAVSGRLQSNNYEKEGNSYYNCNLIGSSLYVM
ncbi:MAG: single-stranded DNA-binding protein [Erysipelotrichaceae bacterium]|nr:single-stranded DNA-binding protein [Erysipelotrichaceae bacterium]MBR5754597.1 single-stranded DNA-binding protein [Erysipelotrichaceae bacterium]